MEKPCLSDVCLSDFNLTDVCFIDCFSDVCLSDVYLSDVCLSDVYLSNICLSSVYLSDVLLQFHSLLSAALLVRHIWNPSISTLLFFYGSVSAQTHRATRREIPDPEWSVRGSEWQNPGSDFRIVWRFTAAKCFTMIFKLLELPWTGRVLEEVAGFLLSGVRRTTQELNLHHTTKSQDRNICKRLLTDWR